MPPVESGRYMCVTTGGWLAWIIRKACKSPVNHALIVTADGGIIEARPDGVHVGTLSEYAGAYAVANTGEPMTDTQRAAVVAKAESLLNVAYNWADIAAIGLADIGWHWRFLIRVARADRMLICSQLVAQAGAAAGLDWLAGRPDPSQVTPADLAKRPGVQPVSI